VKRSLDVNTLVWLLMVYAGLPGVDTNSSCGALLFASVLNAAICARLKRAGLLSPSLVLASPVVSALVKGSVLDTITPPAGEGSDAWTFGGGRPLVDPTYLEAAARAIDDLVVEYRHNGRFTEIRAGASVSQIAEIMVEAEPSLAATILDRTAVAFSSSNFDGSPSGGTSKC
jgi:hypothetical protein